MQSPEIRLQNNRVSIIDDQGEVSFFVELAIGKIWFYVTKHSAILTPSTQPASRIDFALAELRRAANTRGLEVIIDDSAVDLDEIERLEELVRKRSTGNVGADKN